MQDRKVIGYSESVVELRLSDKITIREIRLYNLYFISNNRILGICLNSKAACQSEQIQSLKSTKISLEKLFYNLEQELQLSILTDILNRLHDKTFIEYGQLFPMESLELWDKYLHLKKEKDSRALYNIKSLAIAENDEYLEFRDELPKYSLRDLNIKSNILFLNKELISSNTGVLYVAK